MSDSISQFFAELLVPFGSEPPPPPVPPPQVRTMTFDNGLGNQWWLALQVTDSGDNLRDKAIKSFVATGKMTVPQFSFYRYGPEADINVTDVERGINSATGKRNLPSTTQVQRTARRQVNVPGSMLHTCRLEGIWDGEELRDRVDEIVYEVASQGSRR